jgi:hypothetical protein
MYPFLVHLPAFSPQERPSSAVAVAGVLLRKRHQTLGERPVFSRFLTDVGLARPGLPDRLARPTFGDLELPPHVLDGRPPPSRAQTFFRLTSFRMLMSTAWSATIFFLSRAFSFSSSFKRFIASAFMPPY